MKIHISLVALVAISGAALAQDESTTPATPAAPTTTIPTTPAFRDVPRDHWAYAAIQRLAGAGIIEGYPATATTATVAEVVPPVQEAPKTAPVVATAKAKVGAPKAGKNSAAKAGFKKPVASGKAKAAR